jgi:hypothetical protein
MEKILEILSTEVENENSIHLYYNAAHCSWYAYEQSACQLARYICTCALQPVTLAEYEVQLIRVEVTTNELHTLPSWILKKSVSREHIELLHPDVFDHDIFSYWKRKIIQNKQSIPYVEN